MTIRVHAGFLSLVLLAGCSNAPRAVPASQPPRAQRQNSNADVAANLPSHGSSFFVATNGNDAWSGRLDSPNPRRADGPFATLARALQAIRESSRQSGAASPRPSVIYVRGGLFPLSEPVLLNPEDSGTQIAAFPNEAPVLSGGKKISGWREAVVNGKRMWTVEIPECRNAKWFFHELWINGQRAIRARHPNQGYFSIAEVPDKTPDWTQGHTRFRFKENDLRAWTTVTNAEVVVMSRWVESRLPVLEIDENKRLVSFAKKSVFELATGDLYYLENALELVDQPGEWYLDPATGTLYYLPRPGERLDQIEAIAPALAQVMRLEGKPETGKFVERVTLRGLTFAHTEWCFPEGFQSGRSKVQVSPEPKAEVGGFAQAAIGVPGAVWGAGVRLCSFEQCTFAKLGNYGLELTEGCQSNRIDRCEFADLGAGGLKLGETRIPGAANALTRANEISNCLFHDGGKMFHSAIGVWIGQSSDNLLTHNLIYNFYYTGISIGWTWGYGPSTASNNTVAFNHVHHIGVKTDGDGPILSDMGGIYTLGKQPGGRILNNLWHDIAGLRYGGWGIYLDEGASGVLVQSNVVYRTTHGGFHQHYGETNLIRNNLFAFGRDQQLQRTRPEPHLSFSFQTNIVFFDKGNLLAGDWSGDNFQADWNVYFDARTEASPGSLRFGQITPDQWHARGHDIHSIVADPLFIAPQKDDFGLRTNSPALQLGFQPIDLTPVGPRLMLP